MRGKMEVDKADLIMWVLVVVFWVGVGGGIWFLLSM